MSYAIRRIYNHEGKRMWGIFLRGKPPHLDLLLSAHYRRRMAEQIAHDYRRLDRIHSDREKTFPC